MMHADLFLPRVTILGFVAPKLIRVGQQRV